MLMGYEPAAYFKINEAVTGDRRPATGHPAIQSDFMGNPRWFLLRPNGTE